MHSIHFPTVIDWIHLTMNARIRLLIEVANINIDNHDDTTNASGDDRMNSFHLYKPQCVICTKPFGFQSIQWSLFDSWEHLRCLTLVENRCVYVLFQNLTVVILILKWHWLRFIVISDWLSCSSILFSRCYQITDEIRNCVRLLYDRSTTKYRRMIDLSFVKLMSFSSNWTWTE